MGADPMQAGSQAHTLVADIRKRKGIKPEVQPLGEYEDKVRGRGLVGDDAGTWALERLMFSGWRFAGCAAGCWLYVAAVGDGRLGLGYQVGLSG
jgi:hypothetical protein